MYNYSWLLILILVLDISDIFIFGLEKIPKITKSTPQKLIKKSNSKVIKTFSNTTNKTPPAKLSINKQLITKHVLATKLTTKRVTYKGTTLKVEFKPSKKTVKPLQKFLLWLDVFFITSEKEEPEEVFPIDEGFLLVTSKKPTTKMKAVPTKSPITSKVVTKWLPTKLKTTTTNLKTITKLSTPLPSKKIMSSTLKTNKQPASKVKAETKKTVDKPGQRRLLQVENLQPISYECITNAQCNQTNYEICIIQDLRKECHCLAGYSRDNVMVRTCHPVKTFKCIIWFNIPYKELYNDFVTLEYREMAAYFLEVLRPFLSKNDVKDNVYMSHFIKTIPSHFWSYVKNGRLYTIGDGYILFHKREFRNLRLTTLELQTLLKNLTNNDKVLKFEIKAPYDCEDIEMNYCSANATCNSDDHKDSNTVCKCKPGFRDISAEHFLPPGAQCEAICYTDYCFNNGVCTLNNDLKTKECKCPTWFIMSRCEWDLRWLIGVVAGCLLLLLLFVLLSIHNYFKLNKKNKPRLASGTTEPINYKRQQQRHTSSSVLYGDIPIALGQDSRIQTNVGQPNDLYAVSENFFPRAHV